MFADKIERISLGFNDLAYKVPYIDIHRPVYWFCNLWHAAPQLLSEVAESRRSCSA